VYAAKRVGEISDGLDECDHRAEERRQRHTGENQDRARCAAPSGGSHRIHDGERARRSEEAAERDGRQAHHHDIDVKRDREPGAERRTGRDTQRVRRSERIPEERLKNDAGDGQSAPDQRRRHDARKPCDEKDLRVHIVGEWNGPAERSRQPDRRAADDGTTVR